MADEAREYFREIAEYVLADENERGINYRNGIIDAAIDAALSVRRNPVPSRRAIWAAMERAFDEYEIRTIA